MRALIVTRLSRLVEDSTSAERQQMECRALCDRMGWEVVGVAEDLNVSAGKTSPFERPSLRSWLGDGVSDPGRMNEIDVIVFWRLDRLVRSVTQTADVIRWLEKFGVSMKSATEDHIDLTSSFGKVIASLVSSFAEMELEAIRERISADQQYRVRNGKFRGGRTPWGYRHAEDDAGAKVLIPDAEQVKLIHRVIDELFAGKSANAIAHELNAEGVPSALDQDRLVKGLKPLGGKWSGNHLTRSLSSPTLLGQVVVADPLLDKQGKPVYVKGRKQYGERYLLLDSSGVPVQRAEPVVSFETFNKLQALFKQRAQGTRQNSASSSLLTGVLFCGCCGAPAYKISGGKGRKPRYRCRTKQYQVGECSSSIATVDFDWINGVVENLLLALMRGAVKREKRWRVGTDTTEQQEQLKHNLRELINKSGVEPYTVGTPAYDMLQDHISELSKRLNELQAVEPVAPGWEWCDTDESFEDWWNGLETQEKNQFMKDAGVRVEYVNPPGRERGDYPHVYPEVDVFKLNGGYAGDFPAKNVGKILESMPDGHVLEVVTTGNGVSSAVREKDE